MTTHRSIHRRDAAPGPVVRHLHRGEIRSYCERVVLAPGRARPVVALSTDPATGRPGVAPGAVATAVAGRAEIVVIPDGPATYVLGDALPRLGAHSGAIRIWRAPLAMGDRPALHPLIRRPGPSEEATLEHLLRLLGIAAPPPRPPDGERVSARVTGIERLQVVCVVEGVRATISLGRLSRASIRHPGDVVRVGQTVTATVIGASTGTLLLDLSGMEGDPWVTLAEQAGPGDVVRARVVTVGPHWASVELLPGVLARIPESRLRGRPHLGEVIPVRILSHDPRAPRIELSQTAAPLAPSDVVAVRMHADGPVFAAADDDGAPTGIAARPRRVTPRPGARRPGDGTPAARTRKTGKGKAGNGKAPAAGEALRDEAGFRAAVVASYDARYLNGDRTEFPLRPFSLADGFLDSLRRLGGVPVAKVVEVCADVVADRANRYTVKPLGAGPTGPQRTREDGARAWRLRIQERTPAARRLHYWTRGTADGRTFELQSVSTHDGEI